MCEGPGAGYSPGAALLRNAGFEEGQTMTTTQFQDFPLADRDREWDGAAAEARVRQWADATDGPTARYRDAHVWYDGDSPDNFTAYKLLITDILDGRPHAVPRAVIAAAGVLQGARGGVDLPDDEVGRVRGHLARYYEKMGDAPPWQDQ